MIQEIFIELAMRTPIAAVAIYAIWRISEVMMVMARTIENIAVSQNATIGSVVTHEMTE